MLKLAQSYSGGRMNNNIDSVHIQRLYEDARVDALNKIKKLEKMEYKD